MVFIAGSLPQSARQDRPAFCGFVTEMFSVLAYYINFLLKMQAKIAGKAVWGRLSGRTALPKSKEISCLTKEDESGIIFFAPAENPVQVRRGSIAQLGEHLPYKQRVTGSSPVVPTIFLPGPVVQLVRTPACHAGGHGFEPHSGRHICLGSSVGRAAD